ncbi:glycosyltransferase [Paracoccus fontiphilus]|uniref:Glycosyltransferase n=1 Tax=Paracoccus fontiphilus TaxID=1815556 RepID=A0ABV7IL01_9RHOB|nr:glycosyltransferase [Paracoccus fontiphilus]
MVNRPRVLLLAEAANPEWVSVPLIGWSLATALREVADVHVVTQIRNRDAFLRAGMVEERDFTAIDSEALAKPLFALAGKLRMGKGVGWTTTQLISSLGYGYFERLVWQRFGADIRAGTYDLVHRITPVSPVVNSPIAARCAAAGVPFLFGPINGGVPWPKGFASEQRREKEWLSRVRGLYRLHPARARMLRSASAILCGSSFALSEVPSRFAGKAVYLPENAVDLSRFHLVAGQDGSLPVKACFVGRLVPLKGVDMALKASAPLIREGRMTFDIVGDGPQMSELQALARSEGVAGGVTFHGWKEHHEVQGLLASCNLLLFPSIREFGGGVVLEAMALGVPPVVVDYGGPAELVDDSTGWRVPLGDRDRITGGIRQALDAVLADLPSLAAKGRACRQRVAEDFTWSAKARQIATVWAAVQQGLETLPQPMHRPDAAVPAGDARRGAGCRPPGMAA